MLYITIVTIIAVSIEVIIIQQKCVDTVKQINPEKKVSVYDIRFEKKWIDDCDEAEKIIIGKCAYKRRILRQILCVWYYH